MAKRELPRFEVVEVVVGGRKRFLAYDHLLRLNKHPLDPRSRNQAFSLVERMAEEARKKGEPLTTVRTETPVVKKPTK